jgi:hypothetical protein
MRGWTTRIQLELLILWFSNPVEHNSTIVRLTQWQQPSVVVVCLFNSTEQNQQNVGAEMVATIRNMLRASARQTVVNIKKQTGHLAEFDGENRPFVDKLRQLSGEHDSKAALRRIEDSLDQQRVVAA